MLAVLFRVISSQQMSQVVLWVVCLDYMLLQAIKNIDHSRLGTDCYFSFG